MTTFISFKGDAWHHKTKFIPVAFDLSAYNKTGSERIMYMCVKSIEFAVCTILLLDFENVPTLSLGRYFCWWTISCRIHHQRGVFNIVAARLSYVEKSDCTKASLAAT